MLGIVALGPWLVIPLAILAIALILAMALGGWPTFRKSGTNSATTLDNISYSDIFCSYTSPVGRFSGHAP